MDNSNEYIQDWSSQDMITFIKYTIEETEVTCHWVHNGTFCNDLVKAKSFKAHLHNKHGITSESQLYQCLWHECLKPPMKRSSLERHMKEQHVPAKWACPFCTQTFTREGTMMEHIGRTPGHA